MPQSPPINAASLSQNPIRSPRFQCVFLPLLLPTLHPIASHLGGDMAVDMAVPPASAAYFPVVFFDGDHEVDIGSVPVHPALGFKKFQAVVSQRIGVAPHQISLSLVRRKKARISPEVRRKVPIDEASDFAAIARERDCFVLAVLRRSRRERRSRSRRKGHDDGVDERAPASEVKILRRGQSGVLDPAHGMMVGEAVSRLGLWNYEAELWNLQHQREKYYMSAAAELSPYSRLTSRPAVPGSCEVCEAAKAVGLPPVFHWCVHDAVTFGFRSPVGPIQRPLKKEFETSA